MPRILIVKTSSMGDVVHNLPIVNDILRARPGSIIDWVVEEAYADIPRLHPGVAHVIPVAQRRWRGAGERAATEKQAFTDLLQQTAYDLVLDTQGLLKSAALVRQARLAPGGKRVGFSHRVVREMLARVFYDRGVDVDKRLHAAERIRALAAGALGYTVNGGPDFGLKVDAQRFAWLPEGSYAVLLHATSRAEKTWPVEDWRSLASDLVASGATVVFPWGSESEHRAAEALARNIPGCIVAPKLILKEAAALLAGAKSVVGVDTGLTHLAAALETPTVALFGATPRWRYAPYWTPRAISLGDHGVQPGVAEIQAALTQLAQTGSVA